MKTIRKITDNNLGLEPKEFNNPDIEYYVRVIIINEESKIGILNENYDFSFLGLLVDDTNNMEDKIENYCEQNGLNIELVGKLGIIEEHKNKKNLKAINHVFIAQLLGKQKFIHDKRIIWYEKDEIKKLFKIELENLLKYDTKFSLLRDQEILNYYLKIWQ